MSEKNVRIKSFHTWNHCTGNVHWRPTLWLMSDSWILSSETTLVFTSMIHTSSHRQKHTCLCVFLLCFWRLPGGLTLLFLFCSQIQVCHCWGSSRDNPWAQLQKAPLKTTLSVALETQLLPPAEEVKNRKPSPLFFFFFISTKCSPAQPPHKARNTRSRALSLSAQISARQRGKVGGKRETQK